MHNEYPATRYHAELPPVVVRTADEEAALGPDWADSPAKVAQPGDEGSDAPILARRRRGGKS